MSSALTLKPVLVATGGADEDGMLVFAGDHLTAVLVQLAGGHDAVGHWFLEHGFGMLDVAVPPTFPDLEAAEAWITDRLLQDERQERRYASSGRR